MLKNIKGVAFDLDGTLYPNRRLNKKLLPFIIKEWRLLAAFGKARIIIRKEQEEKANIDSGFAAGFYGYQAEITAKILNVESEPLQEKIEKLIYRGWEPLFKNIKLFKGALETLDALKKAGYKLGLLSDFPPVTKLEYLGLEGYWEAAHCSEDTGTLKPHPLSFLRMAEAMSLPPENILYVGNSHSYDVIGAARAGMKTAWLKPVFSDSSKKRPVPDFSFTNYRQFSNFMLN